VLPAGGGVVPFMPGSTKGADSVPALLTPGEMVLNERQQNMLGGQAALASMFGFGAMARFAAGGIAGGHPKRRRSGKSPHHKIRGRGIRTTNSAARAALSAVDAVNQQEDDTDRAYGQLVRLYDISQEQFIRTGPDGVDYVSQPDISQR